MLYSVEVSMLAGYTAQLARDTSDSDLIIIILLPSEFLIFYSLLRLTWTIQLFAFNLDFSVYILSSERVSGAEHLSKY